MAIATRFTDQAFAFEKLTVDGATTLTATVYQSGGVDNAVQRKIAKTALITVETDAIRVRFDGTAPDSTTGHLIASGDSLFIQGARSIQLFKAIKVTNAATIQVSYAT